MTRRVKERHRHRQIGDAHIVAILVLVRYFTPPHVGVAEPHRELGEVADLAVDRDRTAVLLRYDLVADAQAQYPHRSAWS